MLPAGSDPRFDPPGAVGGLNVLESAGGAVSIQLDARLLPGHDPDALVEAFKRQALAWVAQLGQGELELAELERRWREEEEIAAIVDRELTPGPAALESLR